jgi:clan AA aspartic protease (TIGR02281 family)
MGLWDRDYWSERHTTGDWKDGVYNPKEFRGKGRFTQGRLPTCSISKDLDYQLPVSARSSSKGAFIFWVIFLAALWFGFHQRESLPLVKNWLAKPDLLVGPFGDLTKCGVLPPSGTAQRFLQPAAGQGEMTSLELVNNHSLPVVAVLGDLTSGAKQFVVVIKDAAKTTLQLPVGHYELILHSGPQANWCNLAKGFASGISVNMTGGLVAQSSLTTQVVLATTDKSPEGFSVAYNSVKATADSTANILRLPRVNGHYLSAGSVNGVPLVFMVDTGATSVAISSGMAARVGISQCVPRTFSTANGKAQGCMAKVPEITFGGFRLSNIDVAVMPNLSSEALLGMNVLRLFRIEQANDTLIISRP